MSSVYISTTSDESASVLAVALLDELRISLLECLLAVEALPDEVSLKFDELAVELRVAYNSARIAYGAASLLRQGAVLDERWGQSPSRPKAIYARHNAAVRQGAAASVPATSAVAHTEQMLWASPALDRTQDVVGPRQP